MMVHFKGHQKTLRLYAAQCAAKPAHQISDAAAQTNFRPSPPGAFECLLDAAEASLQASQVIATADIVIEPVGLVLENTE